jgi:3-hydroxyisobutyrate dehydrogenase
MKVGIVGTGKMGLAIGERLLNQGCELSVWNRTPSKAEPLLTKGAGAATSPRALAEQSDIVLSLLTDSVAIDAAYRGVDGLLSGSVAGKLFVEMSTVRPETQRALAKDVQVCKARLLECPVGGSTGPAREGKLLGFAGGDAADLEKARPILEKICRRIEHLGPVGAGCSMKLAINLPLMVYWQACSEALALCQPMGLDPARIIDIFSDSSGGPNVLKSRGGMLVAALGGTAPLSVTFDIDSMRKDLATMIAEGHSLGYAMPVTEQTLTCFDEAAGAGLGGSDVVMLPARWVKKKDR